MKRKKQLIIILLVSILFSFSTPCDENCESCDRSDNICLKCKKDYNLSKDKKSCEEDKNPMLSGLIGLGCFGLVGLVICGLHRWVFKTEKLDNKAWFATANRRRAPPQITYAARTSSAANQQARDRQTQAQNTFSNTRNTRNASGNHTSSQQTVTREYRGSNNNIQISSSQHNNSNSAVPSRYLDYSPEYWDKNRLQREYTKLLDKHCCRQLTKVEELKKNG